ncbi:MAG: hypothetical protein A2W90_06265 [Bacteroidetes bacterium GWF2_42_66]|nr:MAG: hypothetical protein A2W92_17780 [Bacteroidetes bacterium GWA2_42_15]OFX97040.1 MAG: hypothetical protein A2W89_03910 [Bacteroidetes bacterium GWE2_42_39]OFY46156.1 MAG: hypothetical protein A2W90_06265 [Bacteroidetes bacterium GWF2_42_66]HBL75665.1 hypothetical protein [Prolixibacteraceae bacterium]HCR91121.1 hypothetical protein [Prolixibacteraceae bacterium]
MTFFSPAYTEITKKRSTTEIRVANPNQPQIQMILQTTIYDHILFSSDFLKYYLHFPDFR